MGLVTSISNLFDKKPKKVMMVGLDGAGKTTILYKMKIQGVQPIPTIGFAIETIKYQNFQFTAFDLGGGQKIKPLFRDFYGYSDAVVFVFDSQDRYQERCELAAEELHILSSELAVDKPILIFANKYEAAGAMSLEEIKRVLRTNDLKQKYWHIQPCSANKGDGILEGLDWIESIVCPKKIISVV